MKSSLDLKAVITKDPSKTIQIGLCAWKAGAQTHGAGREGGDCETGMEILPLSS